MPRLFRYQELSFDMHQVLSTQSFPGNQTSLYSLSFAVDHLDAISEVISKTAVSIHDLVPCL